MSGPDRRGVVVSAAGAVLMSAAPIGWLLGEPARAADASQSRVCCIRHIIDPAQADAFEAYARQWGIGATRCGGRLLGVFAPHDGGETAITLAAFRSLADYEAFEARIAADSDAVAASRLAQAQHVILSESRAFSRRVS